MTHFPAPVPAPERVSRPGAPQRPTGALGLLKRAWSALAWVLTQRTVVVTVSGPDGEPVQRIVYEPRGSWWQRAAWVLFGRGF